jgi:prepilin-type N-terminal cleavage/methylation domain-containing protein
MGTGNSRGFTLIEVVFALFLLSISVIATAPLFVLASRENASGGEMGEVGAAAVRRMEQLRALPYGNLVPGGSVDADVAGYFDASDPRQTVRWVIAANPSPPANTRRITVRAIANRQTMGQPKDVVLRTLRGG